MATISNKSIALILLLLCSFVLFSSFRVDGVEEDVSLTKDEDLEIDNQLKLLNKPAVKTIKTTYGDLYDCVDFYKQPAFDHPSLKNHNFHPRMRPSGHPSGSKRTRSNTTRSTDEQMGLIRLDCPFGTVPIRRVTKEELVKTKLYEKRYALTHGVLTDQEAGVHYAILKTKLSSDKKFRGGSARISAYNEAIQDHRQHSLARMRIQGGTDSIQVGTMTNPWIYNNLDTHIFIRTKTSHGDCFNLRCPGFVQMAQGVAIDPRLASVSQRGGNQVLVEFSVLREDNGTWWFFLGPSKREMGFWPPAIFNGGLQGLATGLDWGGEVSGPVGIRSAPMGSGEFPNDSPNKDAQCVLMKTINGTRYESDAIDTEILCDSRLYQAFDEGIFKADGHVMVFGGPGGDTKKTSI